MEKTVNFIAVMAMTLFLAMTFVDEAGVGVTLVQMQHDLNLSSVELQWVMNAFFLPLAGLVMLAGILGDRFGHRNIFILGMAVFLLASAVCAAADHPGWMIAGRAMQGAGVAFSMASYVLLIHRVFPASERGKALGSCTGLAALVLVLAPLIGGLFTQYLSWRWLFAINIPLSLLSILATLRVVPKDDPAQSSSVSLDFAGGALFLFAIVPISTAAVHVEHYGWQNPLLLCALVVSLVCVPVFIVHQMRQQASRGNAFMDFALFKSSEFRGAILVLMLTQVIVLSITFWSIWLQTALQMSAFEAGLALLPAGLPILFMARLGGVWYDRYGVKLPATLGAGVLTLSLALLAATAQYNDYRFAFFAFLGYGIGAPLVIGPAINHALSSTTIEKQGMGSGILNTLRQLGGVICFALIGSIISGLTSRGSSALDSASAYSAAFSQAMWLLAAFCALSFLISLTHFSRRTEQVSIP